MQDGLGGGEGAALLNEALRYSFDKCMHPSNSQSHQIIKHCSLLYRAGNSTQYCVMMYMGKESKR